MQTIKYRQTQTLGVCQQCGYLALREEPPYRCPICGARRELFAQVSLEAAFKTLGGG